jgi:hypothetical protein
LPNANVNQLQADIDRGRTGDKVEASDPAAAPLGADEEAAGTPVPPHAVTAARDMGLAGAHHTPRKKKSGLGAAWVLVCFVLVFAAGIVSWMLWR